MDVHANRASSKLLDIYFDLKFQRASNGIPTGVTFTASDFVRPPRETQSGLAVVYNIAVAKDTSLNLILAALSITLTHASTHLARLAGIAKD